MIIPYILWSLVYCAMRGNITNIKSVMNNLIMGTASWQLYYIVVLIQLVFVTPILFCLLEKKLIFYKIFYVVMLLYMFIRYYAKSDFLYVSEFPWCTEFLVFYLLGLQMGVKKCSLRITTKKLLGRFLLITLGLSFLEGKVWLTTGNYTMAMSQGKLTSYAYALCFIFYLLSKCKEENDRTLIEPKGICKEIFNMLQITGDYSYGIFYIHCLILFACNKLWGSMLGRPGENGVMYCFVIFIVTYIISFVLTYVGTKILGKKYATIIGLI